VAVETPAAAATSRSVAGPPWGSRFVLDIGMPSALRFAG